VDAEQKPAAAEPSMNEAPRILFACRANAGRSVVAKVLAEHYGGGAVRVFSAGSEPGDRVHPEVAAALTALGLPTDTERPNGFDRDAHYDVVITMGCGETCPVYPRARYEDWPVVDPGGKDEATVRSIVTDIDTRVRTLLQQLVPAHPLPASLLAR
jgi:arsenate reductase